MSGSFGRSIPPHPATVVQPKRVFGSVDGTRPPHPATVVQAKALPPHPATVMQSRASFPTMGGQRSPRVATPWVAQRAQAPEVASPVTITEKVMGRGIAKMVVKHIQVDAAARYVPQQRWDFSADPNEVWWTTGMGPCRAVMMFSPKGSAFSHVDGRDDEHTQEILSGMLKCLGEDGLQVLVAANNSDNPKLDSAVVKFNKDTRFFKHQATDGVLDCRNGIYYATSGDITHWTDEAKLEDPKVETVNRRSFAGLKYKGSVKSFTSTR